MAITEATPIMMPSMVRIERTLLFMMDLNAMRTVCIQFMYRSPLSQAHPI